MNYGTAMPEIKASECGESPFIGGYHPVPNAGQEHAGASRIAKGEGRMSDDDYKEYLRENGVEPLADVELPQIAKVIPRLAWLVIAAAGVSAVKFLMSIMDAGPN